MSLKSDNIAVLIPYFGRLPKGFDLWLRSASWNSAIDFHLIGDCFPDEVSENVHIHQMSFSELAEKAKVELGVTNLESPYKLCDFKPSYGVLFSDIISGYGVWGFSDLDLVYGDLVNNLCIDALDRGYARVLDFGHLSFFPNTELGRRYFEAEYNGVDSWSFIKESNLIWVYDEHYFKGLGGVNGRIIQSGFKILAEVDCFSDVLPAFEGFFEKGASQITNLFYVWSIGRLWKCFDQDGRLIWKELSYVHIQKRPCNYVVIDEECVLITPSCWPKCSTIEEAHTCLIGRRSGDELYRDNYRSISAISRLYKKVVLIFELIKYRGGWQIFRLLIASRKRNR